MFDYSTLNAERLRKLPVYELPRSYHLQRDPGNGCHMDPPGYPTYFTKSVYTQYGNSPPSTAKADQVIELDGVLYITSTPKWLKGETWDEHHSRYKRLMKRLWKPLPIDHPRVIAWIRDVYLYFGKLYMPEDGSSEVAKLVTSGPPERYRPFVYVREFYPEHVFNRELAEHRPKRHEGDWWHREAVKPTPASCQPPGWLGGKHPTGSTSCQHCGWTAEAPTP